MLSRILTATRNIIPFPRSLSEITESSDHQTEATAMVTTRRQSGQQNVLGAQDTIETVQSSKSPNDTQPSATKKRRREDGSDDKRPLARKDQDVRLTPTLKRQKKLAVRDKDEGDKTTVHTHSVRELTLSSLDKVAPISREDDLVSTRERAQNTDSGEDEESVVDALENGPPEFVLAAKSHKRFGSVNLEDLPIIEQKVDPMEPADGDGDSSDDDAPEVVTASAATRIAKNTTEEAARVAGLHEANLRLKRKERDSKLKEQATAKREDANSKLKSKAKSSFVTSPVQKTGMITEETSRGDSTLQAPATKNLYWSRSNLPALLPAEYLSDTERSLSDFDGDSQPVKTQGPQKIKFLDEKKPKDIIKGSTTYHVVQSSDKGSLLAPKADKKAKLTKDAWLQGRNGREKGVGLGGKGGVRKKVDSSFMVGSIEHKKRRRR